MISKEDRIKEDEFNFWKSPAPYFDGENVFVINDYKRIFRYSMNEENGRW